MCGIEGLIGSIKEFEGQGNNVCDSAFEWVSELGYRVFQFRRKTVLLHLLYLLTKPF